MKYLLTILVLIVIAIGAGTFFLLAHSTGSRQTDVASYSAALAACNAYPNGSTQIVAETSRLTIFLPKSTYPNQSSLLSFATASGTAAAHWISNAGPVGSSYGSSSDCHAYYYEFDGRGEVDLTAMSSVTDVPPYIVHFIVGQNSKGLPASPPISSGNALISGAVVLGPTCPVEKNPPDPQCADKPYQTTVVAYQGSSAIASVSSGMDGTFTLLLKPGSYILRAGSISYYPRCTPLQVMASTSPQHVTITCDTGIR